MRKIKVRNGKERTIEDVKEALSIEEQVDKLKVKKTTRKQPSDKVRLVEFKDIGETFPIPKEKPVEMIPVPPVELDLIHEQMEKGKVTSLSPDAEPDLKKVGKNPERYIEINMIKKSRLVDTFFIYADRKTFKYRDKKYEIIEDVVYLLPKRGFFIPTCYYREGFPKPVGFRQTNKGITGKALSLLYRHQLYETLLRTEDKNLNIFIVIFNIATLVIFGVAMYMLYQHPPSDVLAYEAVIMPLMGWF